MSSEEQQKQERDLANSSAPRRAGMRNIDLTVPRTAPRGPVTPPGVMRTMPVVSEEIRGYTMPINVTSTSQLILPANPKRKFLFISNDDALGYVRMSFGAEATLTTGMKFSANGGGILLDNNVPTAALYAIGSIAANSNVSLIEA